MHIFDSVEHAKNLAAQWMWIYNNDLIVRLMGDSTKKVTRGYLNNGGSIFSSC